jgi:hypothetical protein
MRDPRFDNKVVLLAATTARGPTLFQLHEADAGLRRQTAIAKRKAMRRPNPYQQRARQMACEAGLHSTAKSSSRVTIGAARLAYLRHPVVDLTKV